jgi:dTDP-4-amino-4,6-dideoxygalactose transaminase
MSALAIHNGAPVRSAPFPAHNTISREEIEATVEVMRSGILSRYLGAWHDYFMGGPEVQKFEGQWAQAIGTKHALAVNSATSGLIAAIGAAGVGPGDEVIVTPLTMAATATAIVVFNAVPVFADVDSRTFCIDPESIRRAITPRTKAIMAVHWFGLPADMDPIMAIAKEHNLIVIEDAAQAPFATYKGRKTGSLGHMGVFSLNYHKHIHTGEGGLVTTDDDDLAERVSLIRNHAEAVVARKEVKNLSNMIGFNFRLGEVEAAIGQQQLKKLAGLIERRQDNVRYLEKGLSRIPGLTMPFVPEGSTHSYYTHGIVYDRAITGVDGQVVAQALRAELPPTTLREPEGPLLGFGSVKPLYMLPMFQTLTGYGTVGCPFLCPHYKATPDYREGLCPNAEQLHRSLLVHEFVHPTMSHADLDDVVTAFEKVWDNLPPLRNISAA